MNLTLTGAHKKLLDNHEAKGCSSFISKVRLHSHRSDNPEYHLPLSSIHEPPARSPVKAHMNVCSHPHLLFGIQKRGQCHVLPPNPPVRTFPNGRRRWDLCLATSGPIPIPASRIRRGALWAEFAEGLSGVGLFSLAPDPPH